jgi:hypothetical protein
VPTRRTVLAALTTVGTATFSGCGSFDNTANDDSTNSTSEKATETSALSETASTDGVNTAQVYRAQDPARNVDSPVNIFVRAAGSTLRYVTVVITQRNQHGKTDNITPRNTTGESTTARKEILSESVTVASTGRTHQRQIPISIARAGVYTVHVSTADRQQKNGVVRVDAVHNDLTITAGPSIRIRQPVRCTPDCGKIGVRGNTMPLDDTQWPQTGALTGYTLKIANTTSMSRKITVIIDVDDRRVLEYAYRPPAGTVLQFPSIPPLRKIRITVKSGNDRWESMFDGTRPTIIPAIVSADGIGIDGWSDATADLRMRNERAPREVTVRAQQNGRDVATASTRLDQGAIKRISNFLRGPGAYQLFITAGPTSSDSARLLKQQRTVLLTETSTLLIRARDGVDGFLIN